MVDQAARWRAPGRVNLIGEHTDYNDGFCLPLAIEAACTATVRPLDEPVVELISTQYDDPVELALDELTPRSLPAADAWTGYPAGVVWALRERGHRLAGLSVELDSTVPIGAGLSSSAALECSVAGAVNALFGLGLSRSELVAVARQAENDFVGAPTGGMDQLASVFGRAGHVLLCDMRTLAVEPVPFDLAAAGLSLLVTDTRASHQLTDGGYGERRADCEEAARQLGVPALRDIGPDQLDAALARLDGDRLRKRARHVITENARTLACAELLRQGRLQEIGPLLSASHASMRDDFENTVPEVDLAVEVMLAFDAYGARMTGGGFGGCVIGLFEPRQARAATVALDGAFGGRGYTAPVSFEVRPADGLHELPLG
jgi:galactokinase